MSRKVSRKHAFMMIYQLPFHAQFDLDEGLTHYLSEIKGLSDADRDFIKTEVYGTKQHLEAIDAIIAQHAIGWSFDRLNTIDLGVLRLSIFELAHMSDIPTGVSINEAVELCKTFGDDGSPVFVNGVLGKVAGVLRGEDQ